MDTQTLVLVVAIGALWLSVTCGCVALYLFLVRGRAGGRACCPGGSCRFQWFTVSPVSTGVTQSTERRLGGASVLKKVLRG